MKIIRKVELKPGSYEEELLGISAKPPCIASYVESDRYAGKQSPRHWHRGAELFYIEQGSLEYGTPHRKAIFATDSGGFVNSNMLHMSRAKDREGSVVSLFHIFNLLLISGRSGNIIDRKYVSPLITAPHVEIIGLYPGQPSHVPALEILRQFFRISEDDCGYKVRLGSVLSGIRCGLLTMTETMGKGPKYNSRSNQKARIMLAFIHKHCGDKLSMKEITASAFISGRKYSRVFRDCLNMTPVEYVTSFRLQRVCRMLSGGNEPIISICHICGLGNSNYFDRVFRSNMGYSPKECRQKWQNNDTG